MRAAGFEDEAGSAALALLVLGVILVLLAPFAVAAADVPLGLTDLDAAAGASARIAAAESSAPDAAFEGERVARSLLERSRCEEGTVHVSVDVSAFEGPRTPDGASQPGTVTLHVACTVATGRRLHIPWMHDTEVAATAAEAVDPFREHDAN